MKIEIKSKPLSDYIKTQAKGADKTPDKLIEEILQNCKELGLLKSVNTQQHAQEWGGGNIA